MNDGTSPGTGPSPAGLTDQELDRFILDIGSQVMAYDSKTAILDPAAVNRLAAALPILRRAVDGRGTELTYELHKPLKSMGSIKITGTNVLIRDTEAFREAAKLAANFEAYPKTDGTVCLTFTFHGLTVPIE